MSAREVSASTRIRTHSMASPTVTVWIRSELTAVRHAVAHPEEVQPVQVLGGWRAVRLEQALGKAPAAAATADTTTSERAIDPTERT